MFNLVDIGNIKINTPSFNIIANRIQGQGHLAYLSLFIKSS